MTRLVAPPLPDIPEATVNELHALYREGATAEPDIMLDRSILAVAHDELKTAAAAKSKRHTPWWKGWMTATSTVAVAMLGISLTWHVMEERGLKLHEEMQAEAMRPQAAERDEAGGNTVAASRPAEAPPSLSRQAIRAPSAEKVVVPAKKQIAEHMEAVAPPFPAAAASGAAPAAPVAPAPAVAAAEAMSKSRRDISADSGVDSIPARLPGKAEAKSVQSLGAAGNTAEMASDAAARRPDDAATAELWLKHIRKLRADGRTVEASQSLARFRTRYPDFALPQDMLDLK